MYKPPQSRPAAPVAPNGPNNAELEHKYDSDDDDEKGAFDDAFAERERRRWAREGIDPHRYSGDPSNSYEQRLHGEMDNLLIV